MKIKIYNPITDKESKIDPYGRTAKKIYKYLIEAGGEPDTILPDNLTLINNRFVKVKPVEDISNVRRVTYQSIKSDIQDAGSSMSVMKKIMSAYKGQTIKAVIRYSVFDYDEEDGLSNVEQIQKDEIFEIPNQFASWWKKNSHFFMIDSDEYIFDRPRNNLLQPKQQAQLLILTLDKVNKEDVDQYFLDGITNCFFTPIKNWALYCEENSKSKSAKKRYKTINKKVDKYIEIYSKGIPEEDMPAVCNDLQIAVDIDLPSTLLNEDKYIKVESQKKALKKFKYINTRLNHIEINNVNTKDNYEEVDKNTINTIIRDIRNNGEFALWKGFEEEITQVNTLDTIYKLKDEGGYNEAVKDFEEELNFSNYKIEKNNNKDLTDFLDTSLNYNQAITFAPKCDNIDAREIMMEWVGEDSDYIKDEAKILKPGDHNYDEKKKVFDFCESLENLNHIDIRKAYTQGPRCTAYQGYLGKITDFRKTDKIVGLGIYRVKNINFNNCSGIKNMKCFHNYQAYPSPELEFYSGLGITFDIDMGCWGTRFDFEFPKTMLQKDNKGTPFYSKWYGCLMKITDKDRYNFDCKNIEFAKLNAYNSDHSIRYNKYEDAGIIEYDREYCYHSYHIASFVASYSRITTLEQVLKFTDFNQIVSVVNDGIYYKGEVSVGDLFSDKEQKSLSNNFYTNEYVEDCGITRDYDCGDFRVNNQYETHLGAGGCGKTHNNLTDKGLINPLFVAPSWKLARNKKDEYGIDSTTFFHTLDDDPEKWRPLARNYSVFIIDEISMLSDEGKTKIIKRFPEHKIIFCGDVGYQLPPIQGNQFKTNCGIPVFHHTTNYRCQCKKLEKILLWLRENIDNGLDHCDIVKFIKNMKVYIINSHSIDYSVQDLILCATHVKKDKYTAKYAPYKDLDNMINSLKKQLINNQKSKKNKLKPKEIKEIQETIIIFNKFKNIPNKLELEKYAVKENTRDYCNGQIIIGPKPTKVSCELRHAFTIHSIQGETASNKLFIEVNKMRSLKMLYTAMSRARTLDQIQFIR